MPNLNIRKLEDNIYKQLQIRAAKHGVSIEEEVRQIIYQTIGSPEKISDVFRKSFGRKNGVDLETLFHKVPHQPMDFDR
jgi:plasmid stability protein